MANDRKKQLKEQYKQRKVVGGVTRIVNRENGRYYLQYTDDLQGSLNSFAFMVSPIGAEHCSFPPIQKDWKQYGPAAFELEVVEELEKKEEQSRDEFRSELKVLFEMCKEQMDPAMSY